MPQKPLPLLDEQALLQLAEMETLIAVSYTHLHSGIRYCILLSRFPELPKTLPAPPWRKGVVQLGKSLRGEITAGWHHDENGIGHVLTAAMNRYGKSTLLKHLAFQALQEGLSLIHISTYVTR